MSLPLQNLVLAAGKIGREGSGLNPLRGQNNVQGACDVGALPGILSGAIKRLMMKRIKRSLKNCGAQNFLKNWPGCNRDDRGGRCREDKRQCM